MRAARRRQGSSGRARAASIKARAHSEKSSRGRVALAPAEMANANPREYALRFAFGVAVSVVAGVVGMRFGPRAGGLFLAFPAILPAALTLLEEHDGAGAADADAQGGILGAAGLLAFSAVVAIAATRAGVIALPAALVAWTAVSAGLYLVLRVAWPRAWG